MGQDGESFETLVSNADLALSQAKDGGRFQVRFFERSVRQRQNDRYAMEQRLYRALENHEFRVFYLPVIDMTTGRTSGAEALIRWSVPDGVPISPVRFIPILEKNGLIIPIGEWVLKTVLSDMGRFRQEGLGELRVAINLSTHNWESRRSLDGWSLRNCGGGGPKADLRTDRNGHHAKPSWMPSLS